MAKRTDPDPLGATQRGIKRIATPDGVSRIDTLSEDLARLVGQTKVQVGDVIGGRYKLLERLGTGGMGEVFRAENQAIGMHVAIKVLKPDLLQDADFRRRFQREAEAIASVIHPNVARFLDLVVGDPTFLVMEYLPGQTLSRVLRTEKRLSVELAVKLAVGLCRALRAVHGAHVIHRDLKPSNVIVTTDLDYGETAKLIDFGLAKVVCQTDGEALTRTGTIVGTPAYMSPEQISGRPVDPPADIYSLGCLLYHMLAGQPPFVGDDVQVLYKQMHEKPPPLGAARPDAPAELVHLVETALAKDPLARHADMEAMQRALVHVLYLSSGRVEDLRTAERSIEELKKAARSFDESKTFERSAARRSPAQERADAAARRRARYGRVAAVCSAAVLGAFGVGMGLALLQKNGKQTDTTSPLIVLSHPADARIELDGQRTERATPAVLMTRPGLHKVRLLDPSHEPIERTVTTTFGKHAVVEVSLAPILKKIEIRSTPPGAELYVDGRVTTGVTPQTIEVSAADFHKIRLDKPGYEPLEYAVKPESRDTMIPLELQAETQPRGTLEVDSSLSAEVWVDDVPSGYYTPTLAMRLPTGQHRVELKDVSGTRQGELETVTIKQGEKSRVTIASAQEARR